MHKYKDLLLLLILSFVLVGLVIETMPEKESELEIKRDFNISTPEGNYKFENDREFIEYMEGWELREGD